MNELIKNTGQTMSSLEISKLTGKRHDHVLRDIDALMASLKDSPELGSGFKSTTYIAGNNKQERCFNLDKDSSVCLMTGYDAIARMKIIKRWQELENAQPKVPTNFIEAMQLATAILIENQALQLKIDGDKPKVAFAEKVRALDGSIAIGDFAKIIGTGQNRLFKRLRDDGYLMVNNHPMQSAVERKLLVQIEQTPFTDSKGKSHPAFQTRITGAGQVYFEKRYRVVVLEPTAKTEDLTKIN